MRLWSPVSSGPTRTIFVLEPLIKKSVTPVSADASSIRILAPRTIHSLTLASSRFNTLTPVDTVCACVVMASCVETAEIKPASFLKNPKPPPETDYLICESTYGSRIHKPEDPYYIFEQIINRIVETKGVLLVPSFAIGRTQQMIYLVHDLIAHNRIPKIDIHVDSPMAVNATEIYMKFSEYHAINLNCLEGEDCVLNGDNVYLHRDRKSSKALNKLRGPAIILSASGMLTGGRILHHLINRLPGEENIMAFVGFASEGTLGRRLMDGEKEVSIHKRLVKVKATVAKLSSLSGHADYHEILHWLEPIKDKKIKVFVTHGEPEGSEGMAQHLQEQFGWETHIPTLHETVEL